MVFWLTDSELNQIRYFALPMLLKVLSDCYWLLNLKENVYTRRLSAKGVLVQYLSL